MVNIKQLAKLDYDILNFVNKSEMVSMDDIINNFSKHSRDQIEYQVGQLAYSTDFNKPNNSYLNQGHQGNGFKYSLSSVGKKILQDYNANLRSIKSRNRTKWIRYIITTLITILALILSALALYFSL